MTTNYSRGRAFEHRVRDYLMEQAGACYVVRSAGSKGIADLVAFFEKSEIEVRDSIEVIDDVCVWLVQCKRHGRLPEEERELLISLAAETGTVPVYAYAGPNGRGIIIEDLSEEDQ